MKQIIEIEWFLVKDTLPKDTDVVLTVDDKGVIRYCECHNKKFYANFRDYKFGRTMLSQGINIIAWRYKKSLTVDDNFLKQLLDASGGK